MAFEAYQPHFLADQHLRIRGTMRHMAALAAFLPHRRVLEGEGPAFIAMALEATGLIGARHPHEAGSEAAVRVVAIDAGHRIFRNPVLERLGKRRFHIDVTALAECVDLGEFAHDQAIGTMRVNRMALRTRDGVACVAGFEPSRGGRLIPVAGETRLVRFSRRKLRGIADVDRRERLDMIAPGSVARFAGIAFEAMLIPEIHGLMRTLRERFPDIFMARSASFGPHKGGRCSQRYCLGCRLRGCRRSCLGRRRLLRGRKGNAEITDENRGRVPCHVGRLMSDRRQYCACT